MWQIYVVVDNVQEFWSSSEVPDTFSRFETNLDFMDRFLINVSCNIFHQNLTIRA